MNNQIIFSADLHGNLTQYKKIFDYAFKNKTNSIIFGGDITPKDKENRTPEKQKDFLIKKLFPLIKEFNQKNKEKKHNCQIFIILGNDDFISNIDILDKHQKDMGFIHLHNKCIKLKDDLNICGYSFVPLTPFIHKGWEKLDTNNLKEKEYRTDFLIKGVIYDLSQTKEKEFNLEIRKDTIENDLKKLLSKEKENKFIFVSHSPPYKTKLDLIFKKNHVGSIAIKEAIIKTKPLISLHGHVHETLEMSGDYKETIEKTISINCSNDHLSNNVAIVTIDLDNLDKIERKII